MSFRMNNAALSESLHRRTKGSSRMSSVSGLNKRKGGEFRFSYLNFGSPAVAFFGRAKMKKSSKRAITSTSGCSRTMPTTNSTIPRAIATFFGILITIQPIAKRMAKLTTKETRKSKTVRASPIGPVSKINRAAGKIKVKTEISRAPIAE